MSGFGFSGPKSLELRHDNTCIWLQHLRTRNTQKIPDWIHIHKGPFWTFQDIQCNNQIIWRSICINLMPIKNKDFAIIILEYLLCRHINNYKPNFHNKQLRGAMTPAPTPRAWELISWQGCNGLGIYKAPPQKNWHGARLTFRLVKGGRGWCSEKDLLSWGCLFWAPTQKQ